VKREQRNPGRRGEFSKKVGNQKEKGSINNRREKNHRRRSMTGGRPP